MLTTATRPYTDAEFEDYSERMVSGRSYSDTVIVLLSLLVGGIVTWTFSLIVGGAAACLTMMVLWLMTDDDDWTEQPPVLATDVTATASAAWLTEDDSLDTVLVLCVQADQYLLITQNALTPALLEEHADGTPAERIPSGVRLVLLGEGEFRIAMNVALSGLEIPLNRVVAKPAETDPDRFDETPLPDGVYTTGELPARIKVAIGVAERDVGT